jgi:ribokinase
MDKPIVVVGSINLDLVVAAPHIPKPGETILGTGFNTFFGGKGANQAVAVAKLGYPVNMVGNVGNDAFGIELRQGLERAGVNTQCVQTVPGPSGVALITTAKSGENNIVVVPGANALLTPKFLEQAHAVLETAGYILVQLEIPLETVEAVASFAEQQKIPLMLDPAPARDLPKQLLRRVTWLTPNESEAEILVGRKINKDDDRSLFEVADQLLDSGAQNVLLKLGSRGCLIAQRGQPKESVGAFNVDAVDTTAAGDAFNAAFAVELLRGQSAKESARMACGAAAISVTRAGAQPSMPMRHELEAFLGAQGREAQRTS